MTDKVYLKKDEFVPYATDEEGTVHIHHCKGGTGNDSLYITRNEDGSIVAFCHHCSARGSHRVLGSRAIQGRDKDGRATSISGTTTREPETADAGSGGLGHAGDSAATRSSVRANELDFLYHTGSGTPEDWPDHAKKWVLEYGLTYGQVVTAGMVYIGDHARDDAIVYPLEAKGAYQVRHFDGKLKYEIVGKADARIYYKEGQIMQPLVFVEDVRSALKVSSYANAIPLLSTSMSDEMLAKLIDKQESFTKVVVWLDNDNNEVIKAAHKLHEKLIKVLTVPVGLIHKQVTTLDPKELRHHSIERILNELK